MFIFCHRMPTSVCIIITTLNFCTRRKNVLLFPLCVAGVPSSNPGVEADLNRGFSEEDIEDTPLWRPLTGAEVKIMTVGVPLVPRGERRSHPSSSRPVWGRGTFWLVWCHRWSVYLGCTWSRVLWRRPTTMPGREPCWPGDYCYQDGEMCEIKDNSIFSPGKSFCQFQHLLSLVKKIIIPNCM